MAFWYKVGLGGSFGGTEFKDWIKCYDAGTEDLAIQKAYEEVKEEYASYEGMYGLESPETIEEEKS